MKILILGFLFLLGCHSERPSTIRYKSRIATISMNGVRDTFLIHSYDIPYLHPTVNGRALFADDIMYAYDLKMIEYLEIEDFKTPGGL